MYKLFFNKNNDQRKWVILLNIFLPLSFSVWGIVLSVKSYSLSVSSAENRDQIETLTTMVTELRAQNMLLQKSVSIQDSQFQAYRVETNYAKRPALTIEREFGEVQDNGGDLEIVIMNAGGDVFELSMQTLKGAVFDKTTLPKDRQLPARTTHTITVKKIKGFGSGVRLYFRDGAMNRYSQDLTWSQGGSDNFMRFGPLKLLHQ